MRKMRVAASLLFLLAFAIRADDTAPRIVALGGDITEIVYALDAQQQLVAVDSTSQWPQAARQLPNVGYMRHLNAEGILALRPTRILATHDAGPPVVIEQLKQSGVPVTVLPVAQSAQDVLAKVRELGFVLHREAQAERLAAQLARSYAALGQRVAAMSRRPRVVFLLSAGGGGLLAAGRDTAADHAIQLAGGQNAIQEYSGYKPVSGEALMATAPEAIVLMSEGGARDIAGVLAHPGVAQTPAGKHGQVIFVDGQALLGFGQRNAESEWALQQRFAAVLAP